MPTPMIMPKFDMVQETATILSWYKREGDHVLQDEPVLEIETDKVTMDVPAPASGTLTGIQAEPGEVVPVTQVIAYILAEGETPHDIPPDEMISSVEPAPATSRAPRKVEPSPPSPSSIRVTPLAARIAQEMDIDLSQVQAVGEQITKADLDRYLQSTPATSNRISVPATPAARRLAQELNVDLAQITGSGPGGRVQARDVLQLDPSKRTIVAGGVPAQKVPLTSIQRRIADRMQASFQEAPHIALTVNVDVTQLEVARARLNRLAEQQEQSHTSLTAVMIRVVGWALTRHPFLNASLVDDTVHLWQRINIGVATSVPEGLLVPVIHDADQLSVSQIVERMKELIQRARAGNQTLEDVRGGTFTLSNLGMYGIDQFRAVINPPQSAVLAIGRIVRCPVVINEQDEVAVRSRLWMTLSADHRIVDGVAGARFLADVVQGIENPDPLLS